MTERLHLHFSLSCIGEGNGNPLQCSCLENLRDGGAWWAALYGVVQSRTRLKRLSSSSTCVSTEWDCTCRFATLKVWKCSLTTKELLPVFSSLIPDVVVLQRNRTKDKQMYILFYFIYRNIEGYYRNRQLWNYAGWNVSQSSICKLGKHKSPFYSSTQVWRPETQTCSQSEIKGPRVGGQWCESTLSLKKRTKSTLVWEQGKTDVPAQAEWEGTLSSILFFSRFWSPGGCPHTLGRAVFSTQSSGSNAHLFCRHPHGHTQK